jgi:alkylation response protein AidB-like acyl-CoA dehydrogenase
MFDSFEAADETVSKSAGYMRDVEDKSDWDQYVGSGVLGMTMPPSVGGQGLPLSSLIASLEGLAYGGGDAGILFAISAQIWSVQYSILKFGTAAQKSRLLSPMICGKLRGAHAATEPEAGSDIFGMQAAASPCPGGYRLRGAKRYVTSAPVADLAVVFASTDAGRGPWGLTAFLVDLSARGVSRSPNIPKMGLEAAQFGEIQFEDVFVPDEHRLGVEGAGATIFSSALNLERAFIMAPALGLMRRELELSVAHANTRRQNSRTIGNYQSVSNRIADMTVRFELSRLLIYHAARMSDSGKLMKYYSPLVKLAVSEFYVASSLDAIRNKGAAGYLLNDPSSVGVRDALGSLFYSGTTDILRNLIASYAGVSDV